MATLQTIDALLIGDWILDEHWITGVHSIPTSSRTGGIQRFILNDVNEEIIYASAAGLAANTLLQSSSPLFRILGIGIWENNGENILKSFFSEKLSIRNKRNEFRMNWAFPSKINKSNSKTNSNNLYPGHIKLFNINPDFRNIGTDRVIRLYNKTGGEVSLLERIDFFSNRFLDKKKIKYKNLIIDTFDKLYNNYKNIKLIIIKDLGHGCITEGLIKYLIDKFPPAKYKYFISTKIWMPAWLYLFNQSDPIELLIIPEIAAKEGLKKQNLDNWMTPGGFVTKGALKIISHFDPHKTKKDIQYDDITHEIPKFALNKIIVLPEKERVIAYDYRQRNKYLYIQTERNDKYSEWELPMASKLFPELIKQLHRNGKHNFGDIVYKALNETNCWRKIQFDYLKYNRSKIQNNLNNSFSNKFGNWRKIDFKNAMEKWDFSLTNLGIRGIQKDEIDKSIEYNHCKNKFELWRGKSTLDGYICLIPWKQAKIRSLISALSRDKNSRLTRPEVCFIKAAPGSGKSHLVSCIANALQLELVPFNLSQMHSHEQILDCFDEINTKQSAVKGNRPILVFFDEINTKIENNFPYSNFLAPLEDGYYFRNNHKFQLKPCIWIFVGTDFEKGNKDKASDFQSRFTLPITDLISENEQVGFIRKELISLSGKLQKLKLKEKLKTKDKAKDIEELTQNIKILKSKLNSYNHESPEYQMQQLEKIYYAVNFIRVTFKQVSKVSDLVLLVFSLIKHDASVRDIRKFIESIQHIPYEEIKIEQILKVIYQNEKSDKERLSLLFSDENLDFIKNDIKYRKIENIVRIFDHPTENQLRSNFP